MHIYPHEGAGMKKRENTCKFVMENGKSCKCYPIKDDPDEMCYFHSSKTKKQLALTSQRGGLVLKSDIRKDIELASPADIMTLLSRVINAVKAGKLDPRLANSVFCGANVSLKAIELFKMGKNWMRSQNS